MLPVGKTIRRIGASFGMELSRRRGECRYSAMLNPVARARRTITRGSVVVVPHMRSQV